MAKNGETVWQIHLGLKKFTVLNRKTKKIAFVPLAFDFR
jgi:hypothetical protein